MTCTFTWIFWGLFPEFKHLNLSKKIQDRRAARKAGLPVKNPPGTNFEGQPFFE